MNIKMPADIKQGWLDALRSGEYKQGKGALCENEAYCCLGVLQKVVSGDVEWRDNGRSRSFPTPEWLETYGIAAERGNLYRLAEMNDGEPGLYAEQMPFAEIADFIEENVQAY